MLLPFQFDSQKINFLLELVKIKKITFQLNKFM